MFPPPFGAPRGTPQASLTMPETSRRELSNEVKFGESTAFFVFIFNEIDYNLGTHDGATRHARARATRASRPAVLTPRAPLRPEPSRRTLRANLGYRWAYSSSSSRLSKLYPEKPSRKLRAGVAKTTFVSNAQSDTPRTWCVARPLPHHLLAKTASP